MAHPDTRKRGDLKRFITGVALILGAVAVSSVVLQATPFDRISDAVQTRMARDGVPGVVVTVLEGGAPAWTRAFAIGRADDQRLTQHPDAQEPDRRSSKSRGRHEADPRMERGRAHYHGLAGRVRVAGATLQILVCDCAGDHRDALEWLPLLRVARTKAGE